MTASVRPRSRNQPPGRKGGKGGSDSTALPPAPSFLPLRLAHRPRLGVRGSARIFAVDRGAASFRRPRRPARLRRSPDHQQSEHDHADDDEERHPCARTLVERWRAGGPQVHLTARTHGAVPRRRLSEHYGARAWKQRVEEGLREEPHEQPCEAGALLQHVRRTAVPAMDVWADDRPRPLVAHPATIAPTAAERMPPRQGSNADRDEMTEVVWSVATGAAARLRRRGVASTRRPPVPSRSSA